MAQFSLQMASSKTSSEGDGFTEYTFAKDYFVLNNNCTTQCLGAIFGAEAMTGQSVPGLQMFQGVIRPHMLYKTTQEQAIPFETGKTYDLGTVLKVCPGGTVCHFEMR